MAGSPMRTSTATASGPPTKPCCRPSRPADARPPSQLRADAPAWFSGQTAETRARTSRSPCAMDAARRKLPRWCWPTTAGLRAGAPSAAGRAGVRPVDLAPKKRPAIARRPLDVGARSWTRTNDP
jgi:hypothetical protein